MMATLDSELLKDLEPEAARQVLVLGAPARMAAGDVLFDLGAPADTLFLIGRGRISLTLPMRVDGRDADLLVEEKIAGQAVGWSAIIPPHRFTLKAVAAVDSELIALSREALLGLFEAHPALGYRVTRNIAGIVGQRLQVFQAMWLRQMQRLVEAAPSWPGAVQ